MRIAPRTMLCGIAWRVHVNVAGARFDELRELCARRGQGVTGHRHGRAGDGCTCIMARMREASRLASETMALLESLGDPTLTVGLSFAPIYAKCETGEWSTCCGGHRGSSTWPTVIRERQLHYRFSAGGRACDARLWPVLAGTSRMARGPRHGRWPWPAAPTR